MLQPNKFFSNHKVIEYILSATHSLQALLTYQQTPMNDHYVDCFNLHLEDDALEAMIKKGCSNWNELQLTANNLTHNAIPFLKQINLKNLKALHLNTNRIGNKGCLFLARMQCPKLKQLSIEFNQVDDCGLKYLSKAAFPSLQLLQLGNNRFRAEGIAQLKRANWKKIISIDIIVHQEEKGKQPPTIFLKLLQCDWKVLEFASLEQSDISDFGRGKYDEMFRSRYALLKYAHL